MDKKIKLFAVLAIAIILLAMPASAYTVKVASGKNHIQVKYSSNEAKELAFGDSGTDAANKVMKLAKDKHMTINRNVGSMEDEIRVHAACYYCHILRSHAQPVDLVVSETNYGWITSFLKDVPSYLLNTVREIMSWFGL